jgi:hypothetical protein
MQRRLRDVLAGIRGRVHRTYWRRRVMTWTAAGGSSGQFVLTGSRATVAKLTNVF